MRRTGAAVLVHTPGSFSWSCSGKTDKKPFGFFSTEAILCKLLTASPCFAGKRFFHGPIPSFPGSEPDASSSLRTKHLRHDQREPTTPHDDDRAASGFCWARCPQDRSHEQKSQAADTFGAERDFLSAARSYWMPRIRPSKRSPPFARGSSIIGKGSISLPYPESGIRLIRQNDIDPITVQFTTLKAELAVAVEKLEIHYTDLKRSPGCVGVACTTRPITRRHCRDCLK